MQSKIRNKRLNRRQTPFCFLRSWYKRLSTWFLWILAPFLQRYFIQLKSCEVAFALFQRLFGHFLWLQAASIVVQKHTRAFRNPLIQVWCHITSPDSTASAQSGAHPLRVDTYRDRYIRPAYDPAVNCLGHMPRLRRGARLVRYRITNAIGILSVVSRDGWSTWWNTWSNGRIACDNNWVGMSYWR
jgi:hypothetical protein